MKARTYNGGKGGPGVYQRIINQPPPHRVYCEPFLGFGAVLRHKRPALPTLAFELDARVIAHWEQHTPREPMPTIIRRPALDAVAQVSWCEDCLLYVDPPYHPDTRKDPTLYRHELTPADHERLLRLLKALPAMVQISGRRCPLYNDLLAGWCRLDFHVPTRRGLAWESLWMNDPEPRVLHTIDHAGETFRERARIRRLRGRWASRFAAMPAIEQQAVAEALIDAGTVPLSLATRPGSRSPSARPDEGRGMRPTTPRPGHRAPAPDLALRARIATAGVAPGSTSTRIGAPSADTSGVPAIPTWRAAARATARPADPRPETDTRGRHRPCR